MTKKLVVTPEVAIRIPAIAGPTARPAFISTLFRLTAFGRRSRPTISWTNDCRAGLSKRFTKPRPSAIASTVETCGLPMAVSRPNVRASRAPTDWVTNSTVRLFDRSTTRPPHGPRRSIGRNCRAMVMPSIRPLPVRSRISQLCATDCIQVPETEMPWPMKYKRKLRTERAEKVLRVACRTAFMSRTRIAREARPAPSPGYGRPRSSVRAGRRGSRS